MRKIIASEFVTLDGVMESPGEPEELGGRGGWANPLINEEMEKYKYDELLASEALLMGRITYDLLAASWPNMTDETGFAERMNLLPKYVVGSSLGIDPWKNSKLIEGDMGKEVALLKQLPGQNILVPGSGQLLRTLLQHNLVDELRLMVFPIVLGTGKRLFQDVSDMSVFKHAETKTFNNGVVVLVYQFEGAS